MHRDDATYPLVARPAMRKNTVAIIYPPSIVLDSPFNSLLFLYAVLSCGKFTMKNITFPMSRIVPKYGNRNSNIFVHTN